MDSIDACAKVGCSLCTNNVQVDALRLEYGSAIEYRGMGFSSKEVIQQATLPDSGCDAIFASHRLFDSFFEERFCDWTFIGPHVDAYAVSQPVAVKYQVSCRTACLPEREPGLQPPRLPPAS